MKKTLRAFAADESGATAIEYGALVMFVSLALVLTLEAIGLNIANTFTQLKTIFGAAAAATPS
jgi:pilus assembly protein Flp/PilA